jgi:hypothetical protein
MTVVKATITGTLGTKYHCCIPQRKDTRQHHSSCGGEINLLRIAFKKYDQKLCPSKHGLFLKIYQSYSRVFRIIGLFLNAPTMKMYLLSHSQPMKCQPMLHPTKRVLYPIHCPRRTHNADRRHDNRTNQWIQTYLTSGQATTIKKTLVHLRV